MLFQSVAVDTYCMLFMNATKKREKNGKIDHNLGKTNKGEMSFQTILKTATALYKEIYFFYFFQSIFEEGNY
jgi:hypothetical protein